MRLFRSRLLPESSFVTPLRGDTLFGHLCWSIVHLYGEKRLKTLLEDYEKFPFLIVSDAFPVGYLPKPSLPGELLKERVEEKKINRKKIWMSPDDLTSGRFDRALTNEDTGCIEKDTLTLHNSLDYRTFRTGEGAFAPYAFSETEINEREIYLLLDTDRIDPKELEQMLTFVGKLGYGKESGIGKGRFNIESSEELNWKNESDTFMTLSPSVPNKEDIEECWYEIFTRFGKHGSERARKTPFKHPILMADRGAVIQYKTARTLQYIGRGLRGISRAHPDTVHQGYAIVMAIPEVKR